MIHQDTIHVLPNANAAFPPFEEAMNCRVTNLIAELRILDPEDTRGLVALIDATDTERRMVGDHGAVEHLHPRLLNVLRAIPFMGRHLRLAGLLRLFTQIERVALHPLAALPLTDLRMRALPLLVLLHTRTADIRLVEPV